MFQGPKGYIAQICEVHLSRKFKRVLLSETSEIPFLDLCICADFNLRNLKTQIKAKKYYFLEKNIDIYKTA